MEKNKRVFLIIALALALVLGGAGLLYRQLSAGYTPEQLSLAAGEQVPTASSPAPEEGAEDSQTAPDFTVYDAEGNAVKLSDYFGRPIVLNFWASWCGPCVMEMPEFQKFYESYGDRVQFVIVNLTDGYQETVESASEFVAEQGYTFPVYYDTDIDAARKYGVNAVPVSYFIDAEGHLVTWRQGMLTADLLQQGMDLLLAEE